MYANRGELLRNMLFRMVMMDRSFDRLRFGRIHLHDVIDAHNTRSNFLDNLYCILDFKKKL